MEQTEIILTAVTSIATGIISFGMFWVRMHYSDKNRNEVLDKKFEANNAPVLDKLSDIDKKQSEEINSLKIQVAEVIDNHKHEKFARSLVSSVKTESFKYIGSFKNLHELVNAFLLQGVENSTIIFKKILDAGFENYKRENVENEFLIASNNISSKFSSAGFPIKKELLFTVIEAERNEFINTLDNLMLSNTINGKRREAFERICKRLVNNIIKHVASLENATVCQ